MLLPMKAVTRHSGTEHTRKPPSQPTRDRTRPRSCMPVVAMTSSPPSLSSMAVTTALWLFSMELTRAENTFWLSRTSLRHEF
ncbi:hypothetical protein J4Q44_G00181290 [Coregonus suidteri]|uniref:Uncharacterized protein n=1 Tax=Coregonus suidteri TaxID=861788 RepID=A0AAN8LJ53_9TELE